MYLFIVNAVFNGDVAIGYAVNRPCVADRRMSAVVQTCPAFDGLIHFEMQCHDAVATAIGDIAVVVGAGTVAGEVRISDGIIVVRKFIGANEDRGINAGCENVELTGCRGLALRSQISGIHRVGLEADGRFGSGNDGVEGVTIEVAADTACPMVMDVGDAALTDGTYGIVRTVARARVSRRYREVQIRMNRNLNRIGITHAAGVFDTIAQPSAIPSGVFVPFIGIDHIVNSDQFVIGSISLV